MGHDGDVLDLVDLLQPELTEINRLPSRPPLAPHPDADGARAGADSPRHLRIPEVRHPLAEDRRVTQGQDQQAVLGLDAVAAVRDQRELTAGDGDETPPRSLFPLAIAPDPPRCAP